MIKLAFLRGTKNTAREMKKELSHNLILMMLQVFKRKKDKAFFVFVILGHFQGSFIILLMIWTHENFSFNFLIRLKKLLKKFPKTEF